MSKISISFFLHCTSLFIYFKTNDKYYLSHSFILVTKVFLFRLMHAKEQVDSFMVKEENTPSSPLMEWQIAARKFALTRCLREREIQKHAGNSKQNGRVGSVDSIETICTAIRLSNTSAIASIHTRWGWKNARNDLTLLRQDLEFICCHRSCALLVNRSNDS